MTTGKASFCPKCKSTRVARIEYGYMHITDEIKRKIHEGEITTGGCCIERDSPKWECTVCHQTWGKSDYI